VEEREHRAKEVVRQNVDLIIAHGPEEILKAAMAATKTLPIVMVALIMIHSHAAT
jgi:hypothetical protein